MALRGALLHRADGMVRTGPKECVLVDGPNDDRVLDALVDGEGVLDVGADEAGQRLSYLREPETNGGAEPASVDGAELLRECVDAQRANGEVASDGAVRREAGVGDAGGVRYELSHVVRNTARVA